MPRIKSISAIVLIPGIPASFKDEVAGDGRSHFEWVESAVILGFVFSIRFEGRGDRAIS
ncbi:hypothetical protein K9N68_06815 [Kovacikia minuta CCNUW1]|uniref:hypothetical protein n=1 Tax=Kovacikia minuta TaxID=2931930 RepID=UPI001CC9602B|nr:hypothetical protein [Kovacikia minuta]UBF27626.1 hypothetical protein K9N68_06815 [Kovacikia minuta CCNUW1]